MITMAYRLETASGLRLYACNIRYRLDEGGSLRFLDPYEKNADSKIELLFETKTLAKYCRLNSHWLHIAFSRFNIVQKSLFLHEINTENIVISDIHVLGKHTADDILAKPWMILPEK